MATEYYSGTSGRVKVLKITPVTTTDMITWTGTTANVTEASGWDLSFQRDNGTPEATTFESEADTENILYPDLIRGGVGRWTGTITMLVNGDTTNTFERLPPGSAFMADFVLQKGSADGFFAVKCMTTGMPIKTGIQEKNASVTLSFAVSGKLPDPTM